MIYKFSLIEKILLSNDIIPHPFTDAASSVGLGFALGSAVKLKIADQLSMDLKEVSIICHQIRLIISVILFCFVIIYIKAISSLMKPSD